MLKTDSCGAIQNVGAGTTQGEGLGGFSPPPPLPHFWATQSRYFFLSFDFFDELTTRTTKLLRLVYTYDISIRTSISHV